MPTTLWWRLLALLRTRGEQVHPCAQRMAEHLTHHADAAGRLADLPAIFDAYTALHGFSSQASGRRIAWTDFMRLVEAGLLRQVCAAAPGRQARYVLAMDLAALPDDLPADLKSELRRHIDNPIAAAKGRQTRAAIDAALSECEVIREGSATRAQPITTSQGCGRLHTSPYTREGLSPSHQPRPSQPSQRPRHLPFQGQDRNEERARAVDFVISLQPRWARQCDGRVLSDVEVAELSRLVMLLLRHLPESEAAELLCAQVASASDLAGVLRWRIGKVLGRLRKAARRVATLVVDDDGSAHAAWLAAGAERNAANAGRKAALVDQARRRAHELAARRRTTGGRSPHSDPARQVRPEAAAGAPEAQEVDHAAIAAQRPAQAPRSGLVEPGEIFEREVLARHVVPAAPCWASEPEPEAVPGLEDEAALAAERAWLVQAMAARSQESR